MPIFPLILVSKGLHIFKKISNLNLAQKKNHKFAFFLDDTTVTGTGLQDEFDLLRTWGLNEVQFTRAVITNYYLFENSKKEPYFSINMKRDNHGFFLFFRV